MLNRVELFPVNMMMFLYSVICKKMIRFFIKTGNDETKGAQILYIRR